MLHVRAPSRSLEFCARNILFRDPPSQINSLQNLMFLWHVVSLRPMLLWFPGPALLVQRVLVCCFVSANCTFGTHTEDMQRVSSSNHLDSLLPGSCLSLWCLLLPLNCFSLRCSDYAGDQHFQHLMLFPLYCNSCLLF